MRGLPNLAAYFKSVHNRQHYVQYDQIRHDGTDLVERLLAIESQQDLVAFPIEVEL
jgi:hypothetical protein